MSPRTSPLIDGVDAASAARAVTEGVLLADYRYLGQKSDKSAASKLETLSLVVGQSDERAATRGIAQGVVTSDAANLARELANTPANLLTARASRRARSSSPASAVSPPRCSTVTSSRRWDAAACSASTPARSSRREWSS